MPQESIAPQRTRRANALLALGVLLGNLGLPQHGIAEPSSPASQPDLDEATRLDAEVEDLSLKGQFQDGISLAEQSLALREKALGPTHPRFAESLNNLAGIYYAQGAYARAEPLLVRALAIREQVLGPWHPDIAENLNNLAAL